MKTLTGNDLARAEFACGLAISWWKDQPTSSYKRREIAEYKALLSKLSAISDYAYPLTMDEAGEMVADYGDEPVMRADTAVIGKSQKRLKRAGAVR